MAGIGGELPGRPLRSTDPLVEIESECGEEPHPVREASVGCDFEFVAEKLFGFGESITEALVPRSVHGGSEPELDQEFDVAGIVSRCSGETVVVQGLAVVRIGAGTEKKLGRDERGAIVVGGVNS